jgi:hypothetical protein
MIKFLTGVRRLLASPDSILQGEAGAVVAEAVEGAIQGKRSVTEAATTLLEGLKGDLLGRLVRGGAEVSALGPFTGVRWDIETLERLHRDDPFFGVTNLLNLQNLTSYCNNAFLYLRSLGDYKVLIPPSNFLLGGILLTCRDRGLRIVFRSRMSPPSELRDLLTQSYAPFCLSPIPVATEGYQAWHPYLSVLHDGLHLGILSGVDRNARFLIAHLYDCLVAVRGEFRDPNRFPRLALPTLQGVGIKDPGNLAPTAGIIREALTPTGWGRFKSLLAEGLEADPNREAILRQFGNV